MAFFIASRSPAHPELTLASNEEVTRARDKAVLSKPGSRARWSAEWFWRPTDLKFDQDAATWTLMSVLDEWAYPKLVC